MIRSNNKKRRWTLRVLVIALVLFALYLGFGFWAVPPILESQIEKRGSEMTGRAVEVGEMDFNPLTLEARLFNLTVEGDEPEHLLSVARLAANVQITSVWPGRLDLKSLEVSEGEIHAAIEEDGSLNFQDVLDAIAEALAKEEPKEEELAIKAHIERLQIDNVAVAFTDESLESAYSERVLLESFVGNDVGTIEKEFDESEPEGGSVEQRRYHWDFEGLLRTESGATLTLEGGATNIEPWTFETQVKMQDFPVGSVQPYVNEALLAQITGQLGLDVSATVDLSDSAALGLIARGGLQMTDLRVEEDGQDFLSAERLDINGLAVNLSEQEVEISDIVWEHPVISVVVLESGDIRMPTIVVAEDVPATPDEKATDFYLDATIGLLEVRDGAFELTDLSPPKNFDTRIENVEFALNDLSTRLKAELLELSASAQLDMDALGGSISLSANMDSLEQGGSAEVRLDSLHLAQLQPYAQKVSNALLKDGKLSGVFSAELGKGEGFVARGDASVEDFVVSILDEGEENFATIDEVSLGGFSYSDGRTMVDSLVVTNPLVRLRRDESGLNVSRLLPEGEEPQSEEPQSDAAASEETESEPPAITFSRVAVEGGDITFTDTTLVTTNVTRLDQLSLVVTELTPGSEEPADFQFETRVDSGGKIAGSGQLRIVDPRELADLSFEINEFDLASVSPYAETYLARELESGRFTLTSTYEIRDSQLNGNNSFKITNLELGETVESERALNLPIGFAISLLKNSQGVIEYDNLSVSGDLSAPGVDLGGIVGQAVSNLVVRAATKPFRFLAGIVGTQEDIDTIRFEPGSLELSAEAQERAEAVATILRERPALRLKVTADPDFAAEREVLRRRFLSHTLANPSIEPQGGTELLENYDQSAYAQGLEMAYRELTPEGEAGEGETPEQLDAAGEAPVDGEEVAAGRGERGGGFVRFLRSVFGTRQDRAGEDAEQPAEERVAEAGADQPSAEDAQASEDLPSQEEMFNALLERLPEGVIRDEWIRDTWTERVQVFAQELQEGHDVAPARIDTQDPFAGEDKEGKGQLELALSE